jgi:hypothetical protein
MSMADDLWVRGREKLLRVFFCAAMIPLTRFNAYNHKTPNRSSHNGQQHRAHH